MLEGLIKQREESSTASVPAPEGQNPTSTHGLPATVPVNVPLAQVTSSAANVVSGSEPLVHGIHDHVGPRSLSQATSSSEAVTFQRNEAATPIQATVDDLTGQVAALQATLSSREKAISRLERALTQTQDALSKNEQDAEWEAEENRY